MLLNLTTRSCRCLLSSAYRRPINIRRTLRVTSPFLEKDLYETLGIPETATADEIKEAYLKKVEELHPDSNPEDKDLQVEYKELQEIYYTFKMTERKIHVMTDEDRERIKKERIERQLEEFKKSKEAEAKKRAEMEKNNQIEWRSLLTPLFIIVLFNIPAFGIIMLDDDKSDKEKG